MINTKQQELINELLETVKERFLLSVTESPENSNDLWNLPATKKLITFRWPPPGMPRFASDGLGDWFFAKIACRMLLNGAPVGCTLNRSIAKSLFLR